jgi:hypothetical protein
MVLNSRWIKRTFAETLVFLMLAIIGVVQVYPVFEALGRNHLEGRFMREMMCHFPADMFFRGLVNRNVCPATR